MILGMIFDIMILSMTFDIMILGMLFDVSGQFMLFSLKTLDLSVENSRAEASSFYTAP